MALLRYSPKVHPNQVTQWKKQAVESLPDVFSTRRERDTQGEEALRAELYRQIGQLKVELDWLKKKLVCSTDQKRQLIVEAEFLSFTPPAYRRCLSRGRSSDLPFFV
jgi:hypothetical protein